MSADTEDSDYLKTFAFCVFCMMESFCVLMLKSIFQTGHIHIKLNANKVCFYSSALFVCNPHSLYSVFYLHFLIEIPLQSIVYHTLASSG